MILLKPELAARLAEGSLAAVREALQHAILLEHATIPPYLYALYSVDEQANGAIAEIIQSVAVEEMLHLTLACNILNALGGTPVLDRPGFIPTYPGPLPGGVEDQLIVHLAPFSYAQLDTFLTIEQPEDPDQFPLLPQAAAPLALAAPSPTVKSPVTIGQFYTLIGAKITALGDGAFVQPPRHQIGPDRMPESIVVTNVATALAAIQVIIDQGEGTQNSPEEQVGADYAHYYRFMEIKMGRRLVRTPGSDPAQYSYSGATVALDAAGIYPVPTDPQRSAYTDPAARAACDTFNYTYTALLKSLHATYNGQPAQFKPAIGLMMSLKGQAKAMMSGIPNPRLHIGPSFEYQPTNP